MHTISILFSAAVAVSFASWLILLKVRTLSVAICTVLLHLSNFYFYLCLCLSLSSVADFSNTGARAPTSAERLHIIWIRVMVIFRWLYFYFINRHHFYRWVAVVFWLNRLILAFGLWCCSVQHQVKCTVDSTYFTSTIMLPMAYEV